MSQPLPPSPPQQRQLVLRDNFSKNLAPEIRNMVYYMLLKEEQDIILNTVSLSSTMLTQGVVRTVFAPVHELKSLSLVNRAISEEARSIYFWYNQFRAQINPFHLNRPLQLSRFIPPTQVKELRHLTINIFIGLTTPNPIIQHLSWHQLGDLAFCWDILATQFGNIMSLISYILVQFRRLRVLTIEIAKNSFVPFRKYSPKGILGHRACNLAFSLSALFALPCLEKLVLVEKQDVNLDWFWRTLNKPRVWTGEVETRQS